MHPNHLHAKIRKTLRQAILDDQDVISRAWNDAPNVLRVEGDLDVNRLAQIVADALEQADEQ